MISKGSPLKDDKSTVTSDNPLFLSNSKILEFNVAPVTKVLVTPLRLDASPYKVVADNAPMISKLEYCLNVLISF